jgi:hypothetical protein
MYSYVRSCAIIALELMRIRAERESRYDEAAGLRVMEKLPGPRSGPAKMGSDLLFAHRGHALTAQRPDSVDQVTFHVHFTSITNG